MYSLVGLTSISQIKLSQQGLISVGELKAHLLSFEAIWGLIANGICNFC